MIFYAIYRGREYKNVTLVCDGDYTSVQIKMKDGTIMYTDTNTAKIIFTPPMTNKYPADLRTIKLFYEAVNDVDDARTIGEHITQLLIDLYDCHLIQDDNGKVISYSKDELKTDANGDEVIVRDGIEICPNECPDLFY